MLNNILIIIIIIIIIIHPFQDEEDVNSYYRNINLTIGINPSKVLDTKIVQNKNETKCFSHHKDNKLYFHWKPAVPRNYKKMS